MIQVRAAVEAGLPAGSGFERTNYLIEFRDVTDLGSGAKRHGARGLFTFAQMLPRNSHSWPQPGGLKRSSGPKSGLMALAQSSSEVSVVL